MSVFGGNLLALLDHLKPKHWNGTDEHGNALAVAGFSSGFAAPLVWVEFQFEQGGKRHFLRAERLATARDGSASVTLDGAPVPNGRMSLAVHSHWFSVLGEITITSDGGLRYDFTGKVVEL